MCHVWGASLTGYSAARRLCLASALGNGWPSPGSTRLPPCSLRHPNTPDKARIRVMPCTSTTSTASTTLLGIALAAASAGACTDDGVCFTDGVCPSPRPPSPDPAPMTPSHLLSSPPLSWASPGAPLPVSTTVPLPSTLGLCMQPLGCQPGARAPGRSALPCPGMWPPHCTRRRCVPAIVGFAGAAYSALLRTVRSNMWDSGTCRACTSHRAAVPAPPAVPMIRAPCPVPRWRDAAWVPECPSLAGGG
eukprot:gene3715-4127_t